MRLSTWGLRRVVPAGVHVAEVSVNMWVASANEESGSLCPVLRNVFVEDAGFERLVRDLMDTAVEEVMEPLVKTSGFKAQIEACKIAEAAPKSQSNRSRRHL